MYTNFTSKETTEKNHLPCLLRAIQEGRFPRHNFLLKITEKGNTQKVQIRAYENPVILPPHTKNVSRQFPERAFGVDDPMLTARGALLNHPGPAS